MLRILSSIVLVSLAGYGVWWASQHHPEVKQKVEEILDSGYFHTLEIRYTANQIMESQRTKLLKTNRHKYLEPSLKFYPYLLMEVKYNISDDKTSEGVILWDLMDGEMVIETKGWEKTHGFADCIIANVQKNEFKILNTLARKGGSSDREGLTKVLNVENEILDSWLDSCRRKQLIVQSGNRYRLHLQNPRLRIKPETVLDERLVTKSFQNAERLQKRFSIGQVERLSKAAFGNDFAVRKVLDVYLPIHSISVQNPDGSIHTSHWNALNGQQLAQSYFVE